MKKLLFLTFFLFTAGIINAGDLQEIFIDRNGDGINDNIVDIDNNGIPDNFQKKVKAVIPATTFSVDSFLSESDSKSNKTIKLEKIEIFTLRSFVCRSLSSCRADFESDFSGSLGGGTSSSSGCVGGICF